MDVFDSLLRRASLPVPQVSAVGFVLTNFTVFLMTFTGSPIDWPFLIPAVWFHTASLAAGILGVRTLTAGPLLIFAPLALLRALERYVAFLDLVSQRTPGPPGWLGYLFGFVYFSAVVYTMSTSCACLLDLARRARRPAPGLAPFGALPAHAAAAA